MTPKPNQKKWLFWYMVGVLTCVNGSMVFGLVKMIDTGSSASHHTLGVDQHDSRVKRHLRSNVTKETMDGTNEDRTFPIAAIREESVSFLPRLTYQPLDNLGADEWAVTLNSLKAMPKITPSYEVILLNKITAFIDEKRASTAPSILEAVKKVPGMEKFADDAEVSLILKWTNDRRIDDVFMLLAAGQKENDFFKSNKMNAWIYYYKVIEHLNPYVALFAQLLQHMGEERLAKMILLAKEDVASKETATKMEEILEWRTYGIYQAPGTFKHLGLRITDAKLFERQGWETWVSFMTKLENRKPFEHQELAASIARQLRNLYPGGGLALEIGMAKLVAIAKTVDRTKQFAGEWEKIWPSKRKAVDEDAAAKHQRRRNY